MRNGGTYSMNWYGKYMKRATKREQELKTKWLIAKHESVDPRHIAQQVSAPHLPRTSYHLADN